MKITNKRLKSLIIGRKYEIILNNKTAHYRAFYLPKDNIYTLQSIDSETDVFIFKDDFRFYFDHINSIKLIPIKTNLK